MADVPDRSAATVAPDPGVLGGIHAEIMRALRIIGVGTIPTYVWLENVGTTLPTNGDVAAQPN